LKTASVLFAAALAVGCGSSDEPCEGPNGPCITIEPGPDVQQAAQEALIDAVPGDVILFEAGTHQLSRGLSLDVDGVTIRGRGMNRTVLSFADQTSGAEGILVTADDFAIEEIAVEDAAGDGIKVEGADGVTFRKVRVEWTGGPSADNGAYGLYPVQCANVLIDESVAIGASDAGIYVGQSTNVIVRNSRAENNVAGIEIENTTDADVYGNVATDNTGGILIFNLPGLQVALGERTRVFDNEVVGNNTANFAPPGNIVGKVPRGTGIAAIAAHSVEIFDNRIADNGTVNLGIISYLTTELEFSDDRYDPYTDTVYVHDNRFSGGGTEPTDELGFLIVQGLATVQEAPIVVPDVVIDGYINPDLAVGGELPADKKICITGNGDADFANLDKPNEFADVTSSLAPHDCTHPPLPAVTIAGAD
jgi:parallel beta-helix repeat protein